jgi:hypothetical protein
MIILVVSHEDSIGSFKKLRTMLWRGLFPFIINLHTFSVDWTKCCFRPPAELRNLLSHSIFSDTFLQTRLARLIHSQYIDHSAVRFMCLDRDTGLNLKYNTLKELVTPSVVIISPSRQQSTARFRITLSQSLNCLDCYRIEHSTTR